MPAGRPQEYSLEMVTKAEEYLLSCVDEEREIKTDRGTNIRIKVNIPSKGGLAVYLGVARDTLYDWASKYPEFSYIMEKLASEQEKRLVNSGLNGDYNPTISKVLLTKHGYREGLEHSGEEGAPIKMDINVALDKIYGNKSGGTSNVSDDS